MSRTFRTLMVAVTIGCSFASGCGSQGVTVVVSPIKKGASGEITAADDKASMTSDKAGASITSGETRVTLVEIGDASVEVDVIHPDHAVQRTEIAIGSAQDVFVGDAGEGVRVRAEPHER